MLKILSGFLVQTEHNKILWTQVFCLHNRLTSKFCLAAIVPKLYLILRIISCDSSRQGKVVVCPSLGFWSTWPKVLCFSFFYFHLLSCVLRFQRGEIIVPNWGTNSAQNWARHWKLCNFRGFFWWKGTTTAITFLSQIFRQSSDRICLMYFMEAILIWYFSFLTVSSHLAKHWIILVSLESCSSSVLPTIMMFTRVFCIWRILLVC